MNKIHQTLFKSPSVSVVAEKSTSACRQQKLEGYDHKTTNKIICLNALMTVQVLFPSVPHKLRQFKLQQAKRKKDDKH